MKILFAILPILIALVAGYGLGKFLPKGINDKLIISITPLVWLMLFLIGFEFGEIIFSADSVVKAVKNAIIFSFFTTLIPIFFLLSLKEKTRQKGNFRKLNFNAALPALRESGIALSMVLLGAVLFLLQKNIGHNLSLLKSSDLLLLLVVLVGVDFSQIRLDKSWFSREILTVPIFVVIGSLIAALPASWLSGESLLTSLALSSGFGWFTLSSVLIGDAYGHEYGTMALLTDLFRELIAIILLYGIGKNHPKVSIGSAGATALDSTLPIIKQTCSSDSVPLALVSGFLLTAVAPFFITIFLP